MKIAMTGTSGNMGREALKQTLALRSVELVRVLLTFRKRNDKLAKEYKRLYGDRVEVLRGGHPAPFGRRFPCERRMQ